MEEENVTIPEVVEETKQETPNKKKKREPGKGLTIVAGVLLGIALMCAIIMLSIDFKGTIDSMTNTDGTDAGAAVFGAFIIVILLGLILIILGGATLVPSIIGLTFAILNLKGSKEKGIIIANIIYIAIATFNFTIVVIKLLPLFF